MQSGQFHQDIPRPEVVVPGDLAPWFALPATTRTSIGVDQVRRAFAPNDVRSIAMDGARAAVLVAIGEIDGEATVVLTRRALSLDRDPGLIAFPGGYIEPGEHALDAALREAEEEVGLSRHDVEVIGSLGMAERQRSGFRIASYVGLLRGRPQFTISQDEVGDIFEVPLHRLLGDGVCWQEWWNDTDHSRAVCFFADRELLGRNLVWGLTARILWDLLVAVVVPTETGEGVA